MSISTNYNPSTKIIYLYTFEFINITLAGYQGALAKNCVDLGDAVPNGTVEYSEALFRGGYPEGSTATITCSEGFTGGGVLTCGDKGVWSDDIHSVKCKHFLINYNH